jgi:hypothetical protein
MSKPSHRHWNYRAIRFEHGEDSHIAIHEVHYQDGMPVAYSETPAVVLWSVEEPDGAGLAILDRMREALVKPVLLESEFQGSRRELGFPACAVLGSRPMKPFPCFRCAAL